MLIFFKNLLIRPFTYRYAEKGAGVTSKKHQFKKTRISGVSGSSHN